MAAKGTASQFDRLGVISVAGWGGPMGPGTYSLDGINYKDCGLCLTIEAGCVGEEGCAKTYYASQGTVEITSTGADGSQFAGTLYDVVFDEVSVAEDYTSTPTPGGATWCVDDYGYNQTIGAGITTNPANAPSGASGGGTPTTPTPPDSGDNTGGGTTPPATSGGDCVAGGTGVNIGDKIANFSLQSCTGEWVNLHDACGQKKAIWLVQTTAWCPQCPNTVVPAAQAQTDYPDRIESWIVLGEDGAYRPASLDDCNSYINKPQHQGKLDASMVLVDPGFQTLRTYVNDYNFGGVPWSGVLRGSNMEYVSNSQSDFIGSLNQLLNEP